jgi:hypothetical protein
MKEILQSFQGKAKLLESFQILKLEPEFMNESFTVLPVNFGEMVPKQSTDPHLLQQDCLIQWEEPELKNTGSNISYVL